MSQRKLSSTNLANEQILNYTCPFNLVLSKLGKRWKPAILWKLAEQPRRFGELKQAIPTISAKMLASHLRELEHDGLVTRTVFPELPVRIEYTLSALGRSLEPILSQMYAWGSQQT